jgi:hypothetical protein
LQPVPRPALFAAGALDVSDWLTAAIDESMIYVETCLFADII